MEMGLAQEEIVIPDEAPPCVVEFLPAGPHLDGGTNAVLEDSWPGSLSELEILPDGRHLAMVEPATDRFFVAPRDGSRGRWVGRRGEGPGEYGFVLWVKPGEKHLHVFDPLLMRRTVLDPTTFEVVRTNRLDRIYLRFDALVLGDSSCT